MVWSKKGVKDTSPSAGYSDFSQFFTQLSNFNLNLIIPSLFNRISGNKKLIKLED